jgi:hypothetical protein
VAEVLNAHSVIYTAPCAPSGANQTFYFTPSALRRILDGHMRLFQRIEEIESEFKGRFLLNCTRLQIDRMVVVASVNKEPATTLCHQIRRNNFADQLGIAEMSDAHSVEARRICDVGLEQWFAKPHNEKVLYNYDLSLVDSRRLHSFRRDPACDLLLSANQLDVVIVVPTLESLKQLIGQERDDEGIKSNTKIKGPAKLLKLLSQPRYLLDLYSDWIEFCAPLNARFFLYVERDGKEVMYPCKSRADAMVEIGRLYG